MIIFLGQVMAEIADKSLIKRLYLCKFIDIRFLFSV